MPDATIIPIKKRQLPNARKLVVQMENVVFTQGSRNLLDGLNLSLRNDGITTLMGPNGAGKSLTLRLLARLLAPTSGHVRECGLTQRNVALVFQTAVMLRRSVKANLNHALKLGGIAAKQRPLRLAALLKMANLEAVAHAPARKLSGGEKQRLALVRAMAADPKLLLLDEPTASLDPQATLSIENLIRLTAAGGTKIILVTHDIGQARRLASDVVFLHQGFAVEHSPSARFFTEPQSPEAAAYLSGELLV